MKKPVLLPLIASGFLLGCQEQSHTGHHDTSKTAAENAKQQQTAAASWSGSYQGTTPCSACITRCDGCPGTAVDLVLNPDMTYEMKCENLSDHDDVESFTGHLRFVDAAQTRLQLMNVKTRNLLYLDADQHQIEILEDKTAMPYPVREDFILDMI
ncbi:copper resistance protein NlpE N-terminal domain-containing protein [Acinetobacter sp. WZC-1]|uniref:copper resistance protein NlpE N-terminal domain-containing protein n=1 Tax=Acinetobacter sp. WZC-1 TaxID=3459034 RepID=UPI00403E0338